MAEVLDGIVNHGHASLLSLVNRTRPALPPGMASSAEAIVISDDEEGPVFINERPQHRMLETSEAGPSTRPRHNHSLSPSLHRDSKRQRLEGEDSSSNHATVIEPQYPKLDWNFELDGNGNPLLYPNFFEDAFVQNPTPNNEEVQIVMQVTQQKEEPPYFEDPKLQIRMYRGPGFEQFPVPFNTSHREFCDKWDAKKRRQEESRLRQQTRYNYFGSYIDPTAPINDNDQEAEHGMALSPMETDMLADIISLLPDVKRDFVVEKIKSCHESYTFDDEEIEVLPDLNNIVSDILGMDSYPKEPRVEPQVVPYEKETGQTIVWTKDHRQDRAYLKDTVIVLASQFEYVPTHYINKIVQEKSSLWDAFVHVDDIDRNYFLRPVLERPYTRSKRPRTSLEKKYQRTSAYRCPEYYSSVILELQAAKQHRMREILKQEEEQQKTDEENENKERCKAEGLMVTCGCCFDEGELPINRAVICLAPTDHHSFCFECVEGLANSQVGMMKHEMLCMDTGGCKEKLDMDGVGRAVPYKTYNKLLLNEQQAEIAAANLEGLEQCPLCDFKAICDPIEVDTVFSCQNPDCFKVTCRKCHETSHLPKSCEDVKKDRGLNARHKVEEARSAAMMRSCPKCKTNLIKEMGCNKMRCQCGAFLCYVCKADLSNERDPYSHFDKNTSAGKKCALYDAAGVDRHVQEANDAELEAIKAAKEADSTIEEKMLQIETGKAGTQVIKTAAPPRHPAGHRPVMVQPLRINLDNERRLAQNREDARARRRGMLPAPRLGILRPLVRPADHPAWPGNLAPHNPVQPGDVNVNAWRHGVQHNAILPTQPQPRYIGDHDAAYNPVVNEDDVGLQGFDDHDFEPMDLDFNNNLPAVQAQRNLNQVDRTAIAHRVNDFRNEIHRRRTNQQRHHSNRDAPPEHPINPLMQPENQQQPVLNQHAGIDNLVFPLQQGYPPQNAFQQDLDYDYNDGLHVNPWRARYRPPTPIPDRAPLRNPGAQMFMMNREQLLRRGTLPLSGDVPAVPHAQVGNTNQGQVQVQVQHRPQDNDYYGWV